MTDLSESYIDAPFERGQPLRAEYGDLRTGPLANWPFRFDSNIQ